MINSIYCAWAFIANNTLLNIEWPDGNSQYYGTLVNTTKIKLNGNFPNSRYFSYQLYSLDTWEPFWDIYDKDILTDNNPYIYENISYQNNLNYQIIPKIEDNLNNYILIYRLYLGVNNTGGVFLPNLSIYENDEWTQIDECNINNRPTIDIQDTSPSYKLYKENENNNFYPPQNKSKLFINNDANYMISFYNNTNNTFKNAVIKTKLPINAYNISDIPKNNYDVRYFSISIVDLSEPKQTFQTIYDNEMYNFTDDYIKLYISCFNDKKIKIHLTPPSLNTNYSCLTEISYFGILYRQLLPEFIHGIPDINYYTNETLINIMGDYYPYISWNIF